MGKIPRGLKLEFLNRISLNSIIAKPILTASTDFKMAANYNPNMLWVALNKCGDNLFSVYPKLLAELLIQEDAARLEGDTSEAENLVLPSDREWRLTQYFNLVAMQKFLAREL